MPLRQEIFKSSSSSSTASKNILPDLKCTAKPKKTALLQKINSDLPPRAFQLNSTADFDAHSLH